MIATGFLAEGRFSLDITRGDDLVTKPWEIL